MTVSCFFCNGPVDPTAKTVFRRIEGWERKALNGSRRGGSDIALREHRDEFAHASCVELQRSGISVGQESLL